MNQTNAVALLVPEIKELLKQKDFTLLKQLVREYTPIDFADCWKYFNDEEHLQLFKLLSAKDALKVFEILEVEDQRYLLSKLSEEGVSPILEGIDSPDLAKIFHKMPPRSLRRMASLVKNQEALAHIDYLMKFPENTAGSLMHPEFIKLSPKISAKQAILLLQAVMRPNQKAHLSSLFVVDDEGKVLGSLNIQDLLSAPQDEKLSVLMSSVEGIKIKPETDQEEVSKLFEKYHLTSAPVVDTSGRLIGVLTTDDIISVMQQEATEDIAKMAGTTAVDIKERSIFRVVQIRMPWLAVTLFGGMAISVIIKAHEPIIAKVIALASFSPLIAGMGGNVGSQSAMIVVRSLSLGQINGHKKMKTVAREMGVGMMLGIIYGVALGGVAFLMYGSQYHMQFSLVVATGMFTSMTVAATMGAVGPILLHRWGFDPATATGPLITTTTDIISNLTYFTLAVWLLTV